MRGLPVSGRVWKTVQTKRTSSMGAYKRGWDKQQQDRREMEIILKLKKEAELEKAQELELKKKIKLERQKRKEENERKAEVVQKVSASKVKRMKKKQLRNIRKQ